MTKKLKLSIVERGLCQKVSFTNFEIIIGQNRRINFWSKKAKNNNFLFEARNFFFITFIKIVKNEAQIDLLATCDQNVQTDESDSLTFSFG